MVVTATTKKSLLFNFSPLPPSLSLFPSPSISIFSFGLFIGWPLSPFSQSLMHVGLITIPTHVPLRQSPDTPSHHQLTQLPKPNPNSTQLNSFFQNLQRAIMEKSPRDSSSASPEFEFWAVRNPSCPQPNLLTADQLFDNGVLLPLHHLPHPKPDPIPEPDPDPEPEPPPPPSSSASKRWKDIFRKVEKKPSSAEDDAEEDSKKKEKEKKKLIKKDWKSSSASAATTAAAAATDLNINIWPFSRSRSAGTGGRGKAVPPAAARKVSSAPCSRSNSRGESSKARKWPSSPGRPGLHLGRSSPVWQVRRGGKPSSDAVSGGAPKEGNGTGSRRSTNSNGGHARVLNLNVPLCMGYRNHLSCRSDDNSGSLGGSAQSSSSNSTSSNNSNSNTNSNSNGNATLFNLRTLFSKKVY